VGSAYKAFFAWWLDDLMARHDDRRLAQDIRESFIHLFADRGARVVPNDKREYGKPRSFDEAVANVVTDELHFRFSRVRGEFGTAISLPGPPHKWESLSSALTWLEFQQAMKNSPGWWGDLRATDRFIAAHWEQLKAAARAPGMLKGPKTF
jgi:hypothetical protein